VERYPSLKAAGRHASAIRPDLCQLVSCGGIPQAGERLLSVVGEGVGGGYGLVSGLDGDGVVAPEGFHEPGDAPVVDRSISRLTARAAMTTVRWASIESRLWW
jgi:hypothetical protein